MKTFHIISTYALVAVSVLAGCSEFDLKTNQTYPRNPGNEVVFGTTAIDYTPVSRASYSAQTTGGYERIDWDDGDAIRIYCAEASEPSSKYHDYFIKTGTVSASGKLSNAELTHDPESTGLRWGTGTHNFYALYPSPSEVSTNTLSEGAASFILPATQNPLSVSKDNTTKNWTAAPDLEEYLPMAAIAKGEQSAIEAKSVFLSFVPLATAIQFTLKNGYSGLLDMNLVSVTLTSQTGNLVGNVSVNLAGWTSTYPACSLSSSSKSITVPLGTLASPTVVEYGKTITFTVFLQPTTDATDLKISVNTTTDNSTLKTISQKLSRTNGTSLVFNAFKKHFVTGIVVPEGISWIEIGSITVANWRNPYVEKDIDFTM